MKNTIDSLIGIPSNLRLVWVIQSFSQNWFFQSKNTVNVKVGQWCPTLWDCMDYTVHGILQARILELVVILFSRGSALSRNWTTVSCIAGRFFTSWAIREPQEHGISLHLFVSSLIYFVRAFKFSAQRSFVSFSSVQFSRSVMSDYLRPHESQHARLPCPSPTPGVHSDSRPSSRWCHPAISSSVVPFSSCPQSLPASESFPMNQLFATAWTLQSMEFTRPEYWSG